MKTIIQPLELEAFVQTNNKPGGTRAGAFGYPKFKDTPDYSDIQCMIKWELGGYVDDLPDGFPSATGDSMTKAEVLTANLIRTTVGANAVPAMKICHVTHHFEIENSNIQLNSQRNSVVLLSPIINQEVPENWEENTSISSIEQDKKFSSYDICIVAKIFGIMDFKPEHVLYDNIKDSNLLIDCLTSFIPTLTKTEYQSAKPLVETIFHNILSLEDDKLKKIIAQSGFTQPEEQMAWVNAFQSFKTQIRSNYPVQRETFLSLYNSAKINEEKNWNSLIPLNKGADVPVKNTKQCSAIA